MLPTGGCRSPSPPLVPPLQVQFIYNWLSYTFMKKFHSEKSFPTILAMTLQMLSFRPRYRYEHWCNFDPLRSCYGPRLLIKRNSVISLVICYTLIQIQSCTVTVWTFLPSFFLGERLVLSPVQCKQGLRPSCGEVISTIHMKQLNLFYGSKCF